MSLAFDEIKNFLLDQNVLKFGYIYEGVPRKQWSEKEYTFFTVKLTNGLHPYYGDKDQAYDYKIACQDFIEQLLQKQFPNEMFRVMMTESGDFDINFEEGAVLFETRYSLKQLLSE